MKRTEQAEAAVVLKALTKGWDLFDDNPDIDFLLFVNESREELYFYPKKELVRKMERSGLIENLDKGGSSVREPYTHYEGHGGEWKEITEVGSIAFRYRITPDGRAFLRNAPELPGRPVRRLRVANPPADTHKKPLKVVTYDKQTVQKMVDEFLQKARAQIEAVFTPNTDIDPGSLSTRRLTCGPKLWRKLESQARLNGLQPGMKLSQHSYTWANGSGRESVRWLEDQPLSATEAPQF
ncbi:MAG TPA: hypothetical protein VFD58_22720 [Blastocatellia bacterium]|nr:hypothetical protein [Blastocatellia bacterium]